MNAKKWISLLFGVLFIGLPFEHLHIRIFRPLARSVLHKFKAAASFEVTIPGFFEKHIHFFFSDIILILVVALVLWTLRPKLRSFFLGRHSRYITLLFFAGFFSLLFSLFHGYYIQYFQLLHFGIVLLGFHATRLFFQGKEKLVIQLLVGVAIVSAFECLVGIGQFLLQGPLHLHALGEIPLGVFGGHVATLPLTEESRYLVELFRKLPEGRTHLIRASGTFLHPNVFAAYLALSLMVTMYLFTQLKRSILLIILMMLQIFTLFLTFSRAGVIAWAIGLCVWLLMLRRIRLSAEEKKRVKIFGMFLCASLGVSIAILLPFLLARGGFFNYNSLAQNADQFRIGYQQIAFRMIKENPLLGIGFNCWVIAPSEFFPITRSWVHNIYLLIGAEMGLLGLASFGLFCFSLLRSFWKSHVTLLSATFCAIFVGFLFIGLCDFYFLVVQSGKLMFFLFTGLLGATTAQLETNASFVKPALSSQS